MIKKVVFNKHIVIVGFGAMGQALLPLLLKHIDPKPSKITLVTDTNNGKEIAEKYNLDFKIHTVTQDNYKHILRPLLNCGDMLLNTSVDVCSEDLIALCNEQEALYLDLSTEPWQGGYRDADIPPSERTNYALRESCLERNKAIKHTAILTHGANPGMASHFVKKALLNIAQDNNLKIEPPKTAKDWANLANTLGIKAIHIAERDTQTTKRPYSPNEFVNTWSVDGLISEALQPAEIGWGSHERNLPPKGKQHEYGCKAAIYVEQPGASLKVRTWTPSYGPFHGYLITHAENVSIANYLTLQQDNKLIYRPTVHYSYLPCPHAILSLEQLLGTERAEPAEKRVLLDEITDGYDELGVLLMGNQKGAYWYGSTLSIEEARSLAPYNSATSLQVVASALAAVIWAIEYPDRGLIEPEDIDHQYAIDIATPYLGKLEGHYTDWTPLDNRGILFEENIDKTDPWQFTNILVNNS